MMSGKRRGMADQLFYANLLNVLESAVTKEFNESESKAGESVLQETTPNGRKKSAQTAKSG